MYINQLLELLLTLPAVLLSLSVHEYFHAYAAHKLGDPTQKFMGRLTLNPIKHIDPFGFLALLLFRFGWAKPVRVDSRFFKNHKRDMALTALAGPASNFALAFIFSFVFAFLNRIGVMFSLNSTPFTIFATIIYLMVPINLGLGVFNLIPIPPLDGSKILYSFLPNRLIYKIVPYEKYIQLVLILLLAFGYLSLPISYVATFFENLFMNLANGVFNLCLPIN